MKLFLVVQMLQDRRMMISMKKGAEIYCLKCSKVVNGDHDSKTVRLIELQHCWAKGQCKNKCSTVSSSESAQKTQL
jgi:hypothetical protein